MKKQILLFLLLAYAITWLVWITAQFLGVGPDHGEYFAAFGSAGPALAAIFLSRCGQGEVTERLSVRLLSFVVLWLIAWAIYIANDKLRGIHAPTSVLYYSVVGVLAIIPAWILSGAFTRDPGVRQLLRSYLYPSNWPWQAFAFFFWPVILLGPAAIGHFFHMRLVWPVAFGSARVYAAYGGVAFLSSFLFTAALEEPGWRGYLLPQLQRRFSPLVSSLLVWFPWALWHAPLDFHRPFRFTLVNYLLVRVVFLMLMTVILTWLYNRSRGNLFAVTIFHASMNTFPFLFPYTPPVFILIVIFAIATIFTDRMWQRPMATA